ncbi:MAG: HPr kinase/phosphorylase, partial [Gammaproteobacteria bacterium]|nr:HPr kinase/phosphorylase [Gammaproteobacteria bacterium]
MINGITAQDLFKHLRNHIDLHWIAGTADANRIIKRKLHWANHATMVGHLNLIHPNSIQVIGKTEWNYLEKLKKNSRQDTLEQIFVRRTSAIII